jgi:hypothetical protein
LLDLCRIVGNFAFPGNPIRRVRAAGRMMNDARRKLSRVASNVLNQNLRLPFVARSFRLGIRHKHLPIDAAMAADDNMPKAPFGEGGSRLAAGWEGMRSFRAQEQESLCSGPRLRERY